MADAHAHPPANQVTLRNEVTGEERTVIRNGREYLSLRGQHYPHAPHRFIWEQIHCHSLPGGGLRKGSTHD